MTTPRLSREERKAETRARLLEAAADVFARRGFVAASVDEVAEAAGFTKGAVYAHFDSKEELFLAMLDERFEERLNDIREIFADDRSFEEQARETGDHFIAYVDEDPRWTLIFFEFWAHAVRNPEMAGELVKRYRALRDAVAEVLEARKEGTGMSLPIPAEEIAMMTFAMGNGVAMERVLEPDAVPADLYSRMLAIFTRGVGVLAAEKDQGSGTTA